MKDTWPFSNAEWERFVALSKGRPWRDMMAWLLTIGEREQYLDRDAWVIDGSDYDRLLALAKGQRSLLRATILNLLDLGERGVGMGSVLRSQAKDQPAWILSRLGPGRELVIDLEHRVTWRRITDNGHSDIFLEPFETQIGRQVAGGDDADKLWMVLTMGLDRP